MSVLKRQPWLKWYPSDWRAEPRLKMCSRAARSLWVDMLGLMHEAEPYGFLIVGGLALTSPDLIARALGDIESEVSPLLVELERYGVFSRVGEANLSDDVVVLIPANIPAGVIFSRKMVCDAAKAQADRNNGKLGGNPTLNGGDNPWVKGGDKAQKPETRSTLLRNAAVAADGKSPNGRASHSKPVLDSKSWIFRDGLAWLAKATGRREDGLRSQLGKWLKAAQEDAGALRSVFEAAQDADVAEPIAWITKAIETRAKAGAPFEPTDEHGWRKRFQAFKQQGGWPAKWGGSRPGDHQAHPPALVAEFGFSPGTPSGAHDHVR